MEKAECGDISNHNLVHKTEEISLVKKKATAFFSKAE